QTGSADDLYNRASPLCEARALTERHERVHPALYADRAAAPGTAGPAGLAAAAGADGRRLPCRELRGAQCAAARLSLARGAAGGDAVHAVLVHAAAAARRPTRARAA